MPIISLVYTHFNTKTLGFGISGHDTNGLSIMLVLLLLVGTGVSWWSATCGLVATWRLLFITVYFLFAILYFIVFMHYNAWI